MPAAFFCVCGRWFVAGVINPVSAAGLPLGEITIADDLRTLGYKTLALGKWHLGHLPQYLPTARGFDEFFGLPFSVDDGTGIAVPASCGASHSNDDGDNNNRSSELGGNLGPWLPLPLIRQSAKSSSIVEQPTNLRQLTARLTQDATRFVAAAVKAPFFLYFAFGHVHTVSRNIEVNSSPYDGKQYAACKNYGRSQRGLFGDALTEVDDAIGTLSNQVARLGLGANTLSIFLSDNVHITNCYLLSRMFCFLFANRPGKNVHTLAYCD